MPLLREEGGANSRPSDFRLIGRVLAHRTWVTTYQISSRDRNSEKPSDSITHRFFLPLFIATGALPVACINSASNHHSTVGYHLNCSPSMYFYAICAAVMRGDCTRKLNVGNICPGFVFRAGQLRQHNTRIRSGRAMTLRVNETRTRSRDRFQAAWIAEPAKSVD
jgi:hypothetical protein